MKFVRFPFTHPFPLAAREEIPVTLLSPRLISDCLLSSVFGFALKFVGASSPGIAPSRPQVHEGGGVFNQPSVHHASSGASEFPECLVLFW